MKTPDVPQKKPKKADEPEKMFDWKWAINSAKLSREWEHHSTNTLDKTLFAFDLRTDPL